MDEVKAHPSCQPMTCGEILLQDQQSIVQWTKDLGKNNNKELASPIVDSHPILCCLAETFLDSRSRVWLLGGDLSGQTSQMWQI